MLKAGAVVAVSPASILQAATSKKKFEVGSTIMAKLLVANDAQVSTLLAENYNNNIPPIRKTGFDFAAIASAYCSPSSTYYHQTGLIDLLQKMVLQLTSFQNEEGNLNFSNLGSPPDTAFLLEPFAAAILLLTKDSSKALLPVLTEAKKFLLKCGEALSTGGVHTPNHRWVVCAALARINTLYPNDIYTNRIGQWLGEGIFNDIDGHYPERSINYANVENNSLIAMARLLNMPALYTPVRKNLSMQYYYMDPNGDLITTDSRRQDQYKTKRMVTFYLHYRYMAIKDNNAKFAAIATLIEGMDGFDELLNTSYFHFLETPLLQEALPAPTTLETSYEKLFTTSALLRIRRNHITSTLFGGADWPLIIASGRSVSPNFYSYRKGAAALKYMRISCDFFSMGYFYSEGLVKKNNQYILHQKLEVPYYQPMPKKLRKANGDYTLSPSTDNRFWNKMDFNNRPVSNVKTLDTTIVFTEQNGSNKLAFFIKGQPGVPVTIELCFAEGGMLTGATKDGDGHYFLESGSGTYSMGSDNIEFGPGWHAHKAITALEGEKYGTHFGTLKTDGIHVFITGITPFEHSITFQ